MAGELRVRKVGHIGIERNFREAMDLEDGPDIEIEAVAHNLYIDIVFEAILIERFEVRVDLRMFPGEAEDGFFVTL